MHDPDASRFLLGVSRLSVAASIGPAIAWPQQRLKKQFTEGNLKALVPCPGKCHGGGFDLGRDLHDKLVRVQKPAGAGTLKCRGYQEMGRGRRQSCDYTLQYDAAVEYGSRHF